MKKKEMLTLSNEDMAGRLVELKKELMKINAEVSVSTPKNPGRAGQIRRTIARILTLQNQKNSVEVEKKA